MSAILSKEKRMSAILNSKRYTMYEVARLLNVHVATIWRWYLHGVRGRKLPTIVIGARRYVLADNLDTFLSDANPNPPTGDTELARRAEDAGRALDGLGVKQDGPRRGRGRVNSQ